MTFGNTLEQILASNCSFRVRGFFNVEGGHVGVANQFHPWCDCSSLVQGPAVDCETCGRKLGDYVSMVAGDGDGVYVVAEVVAPEGDRVVGALAVFDYQFQMANAARLAIEQEQVPTYPLNLAMQFASARPIVLGQLRNTSTIYFADGGAGSNSNNATVDVLVDPSLSLRVLSFGEDVSSDPADWAARLSATQGFAAETLTNAMLRGQASGQAIFEALGISGEFRLPSFIPRVIMVLEESLAAKVDLADQIIIEDWDKLGAQFGGAVATSHAQVMRDSTIWMNALLAREWDRAAADEVDFERNKALLFDMWTWAYQGAVNGDEDCKSLIRPNTYKASPAEVAAMLRRRGLYEAAERADRGELPDVGLAEPPLATPSPGLSAGGLTKNSNGLGLSSAPSATAPIIGQAKFCSNCGAPFADEQAKFCSNCGSSRA